MKFGVDIPFRVYAPIKSIVFKIKNTRVCFEFFIAGIMVVGSKTDCGLLDIVSRVRFYKWVSQTELAR